MPDKHPILIFNDIKFDQLKSLVAFIYNGSVSVSENNIHAFLNAAQSLLIKGLSEETREYDKNAETSKKQPEVRINHRKPAGKGPGGTVRKYSSDGYLDGSRQHHNNKKQRQTAVKADDDGECEESLSKLEKISFTKYIHQNLNSKCHAGRNDLAENKWNGPEEEKLRGGSDNYVVKSWKHNSIEDLNGRHPQNKNNVLKKIKLEKHGENSNLRNSEDIESGNGNGNENRGSEERINFSGHNQDKLEKLKLEEVEEKIKKEAAADAEPMMLVEPKQEITENDENLDEYDGIHNASGESITADGDSLYDGRSSSNFYQQPVVDRGIPVPLLMCKTSLSEPDSVESNWMPQMSGNGKSDQLNLAEGKDLQCRTCAQDLPCPTCTKKYKSRYALNRHILYECGKARKSFSCDECGKKVTRQDTLQKHKLIHLVQHLKKRESETEEDSPKSKRIS